MTVKKLIDQYQKKITEKDSVIEAITKMISQSRNGKTILDVGYLTMDRQNAQRDRQLFVQFKQDLEDLV